MKMKRKSITRSKIFSAVLPLIAVLAAVLYNAARATWVFVDITLKIDSFMLYLLYAMVFNAIFGGALSALRLHEVKKGEEPVYNKKVFPVLSGISMGFAVFSLIVAIVFVIMMAGRESSGVYNLYLKKSLVDAALLVFVPFLGIFFPIIKGKARKASLAVVLTLTAIIVISFVFPVGNYKITSDPMVIDTGKNYSVVFSTNYPGSGYVEYTYAGETYKAFDNNAGRLRTDSKIHSVDVPYEHLNDNSYKIGSVRVIEQYSYGSRLGKEALSGEYSFTPCKGEDRTYLVVSDWHTEIERAAEAVNYVGEYDGVLFMGDASPGLDFEEEAVRNIVEFGGKLTKGEMPLIYARGNHETRGGYAGKLGEALGLDEFYYTAETDNYSFIVLDSGEDKDDSHPEYGSLTDYNTYRADMVEWLKGVELKNEKVIVLSHSWQVSDVEKDLSEAAWNELDRLGARLMISGHSHDCRLLGVNDGEKAMLDAHPDIVGYMDGGNRDKRYIASKLTLSAEKIDIEAFDNLGEKVFEHSMAW